MQYETYLCKWVSPADMLTLKRWMEAARKEEAEFNKALGQDGTRQLQVRVFSQLAGFFPAGGFFSSRSWEKTRQLGENPHLELAGSILS